MKTNTIKLSSPATSEFWEIPVLFEDEHLLVLDKPARLLVSPDPVDPARPSLIELLHAGIKAGKPWARERNLAYLSNAHRLDPDTTGALMFAKSKPVLVALADLFGSQKPLLKYIALVRGTPPEKEFEVTAPLAPHPHKAGSVRVDPEAGKKSSTRFELLEDFPRHEFALLACQPFTHRAHQVRVHLRHVNLPVVGDELYGGKSLWLSRLKQDFRLKPGREERPLISRVALHSAELTLPHPVTNESVVVKSDLPKDLKVGLKYLRQYSGNVPG